MVSRLGAEQCDRKVVVPARGPAPHRFRSRSDLVHADSWTTAKVCTWGRNGIDARGREAR